MDGVVLVLNQNYEPLNVCNLPRAFRLVFGEKAEVIEYDHQMIRTPREEFRAPSVIRLQYQIRRPRPRVKLTRREVFARDGMLYAHNEFMELIEGEVPFSESVRYRTVGDMTCTGAVRSTANTLLEVVTEIAATRITERGETRADDRASEAAMEDRKREGYF